MEKETKPLVKFLMDYIWLAVIIAALVILLIYEAGWFTPQKCFSGYDLECINYGRTVAGIEFTIKNNLEYDIFEPNFELYGEGCSGGANATLIKAGQEAKFIIPCSPPKGKYEGEFVMTYYKEDRGLGAFERKGEVVIKIK